ncbi:SMP-30/gluconolactonase/LRE family protein [Gemmata sp. JC673]|uniref:SMP-30/gluconolactonase/LRE family protein n=1 Tax=Gemmata algarum TaxID=2975278 RepID=A0ABU5F512_9BACT|nr:SMP-30/gluconolactonase/LRE family protein [Gemmata algarum]MDY3561825.1 SMP-30/gluconolactonase/LRE family protein [Gemmata algarum]
MFRTRLLSALAIALVVPLLARSAELPPVVTVWPQTAPGEKGDIGEEKATPAKGRDAITSVTNVSKPTLTIYRPTKEKSTGAAVVVAPGGGYNVLAWEHEGTMVGEWLQSIGVTGVVLKYRVPRRPGAAKGAPPLGALQDAQRALSLTRSKASEWNIDPQRVGMLGFSAGGHLTSWAATNGDRRSYEPVDGADKLSCRPDFAVLIYPGGVVDRENKEQLAPEIRVSKDTPPCFFALAYNDNGPLDGSLKMIAALKKAGVPAELHVYSAGGHGFGMRAAEKPHATWPARCAEWMRAEGFLTAKAEGDSPVAAGAKVEKLAGGFKFTEGPAPDADGNVYFTDQPNDRILKWSTDGKLSTFMEPCGRSNGLAFDKAGALWACADEKNELWKIDVKTKEKTVVVKEFGGKLLNGPNDIWVRDDGSAFFTDPYYKRGYWKRGPAEQPTQGVFFLSADGKLSRADAGELKQANGIIGTPDGSTLYVADIGGNKTYRYDAAKDGGLKNRAVFCEQGSDGMTIDERGNVYLTGRGVTVYDTTGKKVAQIDIPEQWTANVCFGGKDMKTLFITAGTGLYSLKMNVKGTARQ